MSYDDPFGSTSPASDDNDDDLFGSVAAKVGGKRPTMKQLAGRLVLLTPRRITRVPAFDKAIDPATGLPKDVDRMEADVTFLTGDVIEAHVSEQGFETPLNPPIGKGDLMADYYLNSSVLIDTFRPLIDKDLLGVILRGAPRKGSTNQPPWKFVSVPDLLRGDAATRAVLEQIFTRPGWSDEKIEAAVERFIADAKEYMTIGVAHMRSRKR